MLSTLLRFIRYYLRSTNLHGIHSPFVFDLVKDCVYNKKKFAEYTDLQKYREALQADQTVLDIEDHGAGKRSDRRKVSEIARTSSSNRKKAELLFRLAQYFRPPVILELGTNLGIGTRALALGAPAAQVITIEGDPSMCQIAKEMNRDLQNVSFINDTFDNALQRVIKTSRPAMVYIDGNHLYQPTVSYFEQLAEIADDDTVLVFDDIYWSEGMQQAFSHIKSSPRVTVTVDLFQVGLVFFRKGQVKEDFTVRF